MGVKLSRAETKSPLCRLITGGFGAAADGTGAVCVNCDSRVLETAVSGGPVNQSSKVLLLLDCTPVLLWLASSVNMRLFLDERSDSDSRETPPSESLTVAESGSVVMTLSGSESISVCTSLCSRSRRAAGTMVVVVVVTVQCSAMGINRSMRTSGR